MIQKQNNYYDGQATVRSGDKFSNEHKIILGRLQQQQVDMEM